MLRINHAIKFSKLYLHFLSMIFLFNFTVVIIFHLVFRCNFALMLLAELVLDQASVDWEEHLPLMLHVIFLGKSWRFYRTTMYVVIFQMASLPIELIRIG